MYVLPYPLKPLISTTSYSLMFRRSFPLTFLIAGSWLQGGGVAFLEGKGYGDAWISTATIIGTASVVITALGYFLAIQSSDEADRKLLVSKSFLIVIGQLFVPVNIAAYKKFGYLFLETTAGVLWMFTSIGFLLFANHITVVWERKRLSLFTRIVEFALCMLSVAFTVCYVRMMSGGT